MQGLKLNLLPEWHYLVKYLSYVKFFILFFTLHLLSTFFAFCEFFSTITKF